jgi:outer membrane protein assembly factor BamD (BamD/ComL family)
MNEPLLIDRARAALRRRLLDEATLALDRHAREFPAGQLVEEREVLRIEVAVVRGDLDAARALAAAYRARFPDGFLRGTVDALDPDRPARPSADR